jgi:hypothetical protein
MRIALVADCHLGNHKRFAGASTRSLNQRCRHAIDVFGRACDLAIEEKCALFAVLGDLVDYSRAEPQLLAEIMREVRERADQLRFLLLVGNHEQDSDEAGDHSLGAFGFDATVIDAPTIVPLDKPHDLLLVPHSAAAPFPQRLASALASVPSPLAGARRILGIHAGVADEETPPFLKGASDSIHVRALATQMQKHGVAMAFAGNWHNHQHWSNPLGPVGGFDVVQLGALVPTGFDNPGMDGYGTVAIYDTATGGTALHFLEGPRFLVARGMKELAKLVGGPHPKYQRVYARVEVQKEELQDALKAVNKAKEKGIVFAAEVTVDSTDRIVAARAAAGAARSATTLEAALEGFVSNMHLENDTPREQVMEKCRRFLA